VACSLQYMRFAKKPMSAPCHRLSERLARRCVFLGLGAELAGLRLLPLCEAYPMNASLLVFLYFWKESKRSRAVRKGEVLACFSALSVWLLPFASPADGTVEKATQVGLLVDLLMAPRTCAYVVGVLALSVVVHCIGHGESALGSCTPAGMNFAVSSLLLKALAQTAALLTSAPLRPELWAAVVSIVTLLLGVRSAAAKPLRMALETHDNLSVLAFYGVISSAFAALTGEVVFGEMDKWDAPHQFLYSFVIGIHCWGMLSLGCRGSDSRGPKDGDKDAAADDGPASGRKATESEFQKALQMADFSGRGSGKAASGAASKSAVRTAGDGKDRPPSPLLKFNEAPRTADDDEQMEEKFFAKALAPLSLESGLGGLPGAGDAVDPAWSGSWPDVGGAGEAAVVAARPAEASPQFDADFEELMRRFGEEEAGGQLITDAPPTPKPQATAGPADAPPPGVLAFDAQTLLDDTGVQDDEDELLRSIEDIPGP